MFSLCINQSINILEVTKVAKRSTSEVLLVMSRSPGNSQKMILYREAQVIMYKRHQIETSTTRQLQEEIENYDLRVRPVQACG